MTQPDVHPHHVSQLLEPALTEIVHAISDRGGQTQAAYDARAADTWTLIESFQPRDAIDLVLTGQLVAFNAVFADATRDVLRGMEGSIKQRTQSGLISMVRLTQGHVDRLVKRGSQPYRTEIAAPQLAQPPAAEPPRQTKVPAEPPTASELPPRPPASDPAPEPEPAQARIQAEDPSWVDEPYQEWLIETPADVAAKAEAAQTSARTAAEAALWEKVAGAVRTAVTPDLDARNRNSDDLPVPTMAAAGD